MDGAEKVRENRLRRKAQRRGMILRKSRRRDPYAIDYGTWYVIDPDTNGLIAECDNLDLVEVWLNG